MGHTNDWNKDPYTEEEVADQKNRQRAQQLSFWLNEATEEQLQYELNRKIGIRQGEERLREKEKEKELAAAIEIVKSSGQYNIQKIATRADINRALSDD